MFIRKKAKCQTIKWRTEGYEAKEIDKKKGK